MGRVPGSGAARVVISHEKSTRRKRAEQLPGLDYPVANGAPIANSVLAAMPRGEYQRLLAGLEPGLANFRGRAL